MCKKYFLIMFLFSAAIYGQEQDAWVYFNGKPNASQYLNNPLTMLSQRSIDRRINQNIPLDFKDAPIEQSYIDAVTAANGITVMAKSKWMDALHIRGTFEDISALSALPFVTSLDFADKSLNGRHVHTATSHQTHKTLETQTDFPYGGSANQIQMLNGHLLHQQNFTGSGKIVAILDAGFPGVDTGAPFTRLHDNNLILGGYNFVDRDENFYTRNSHGTMVLSTMGGYIQNQLVGTAPDASYYLFITEDADTENPVEESLWVEAAEKADSLGVDVISTSLGYSDFDNPAYSHTYQDMDGVTTFIARGADIAFSRGMVVVVSAGNSGNEDEDHKHIGTPADAINVLTVGAVDSFGNYVSFSSVGPSYDGRIKPDVAAKGLGATVANPEGNVVTASGTSFSCPITAGMVATFWQAVPSFTNAQVVEFIKESASQYNDPDYNLGYGIPDFMQAYQSALLGIPHQNQQHFTLYPNPVHDNLFVSIPDSSDAKVTFYNSLGQMVSQKTFGAVSQSVNLESLENGAYFYKIEASGQTQSGTLIKQ